MCDGSDRFNLGRRSLPAWFFLSLCCFGESMRRAWDSGWRKIEAGRFFLGDVAPAQAAINRDDD